MNEKFNAMFANDKSTVLNPQARGFVPQHVSGSRNHNSAAYYNDYAENSENVQRCVFRRVLDAENQYTVLRTAEYGNSGNSNVGPNPCLNSKLMWLLGRTWITLLLRKVTLKLH